jgi:hypothetical protein
MAGRRRRSPLPQITYSACSAAPAWLVESLASKSIAEGRHGRLGYGAAAYPHANGRQDGGCISGVHRGRLRCVGWGDTSSPRRCRPDESEVVIMRSEHEIEGATSLTVEVALE